MKPTSATLLLLAAAAACAPEVPAEPTWVDDVRPILAANCIRCHSPPFIGGVPTTFRLDIFEDDVFLQSDGVSPVHGAAYVSQDGTLSGLVEDDFMPPQFPLTSRQKDVLAAWHEAEEPKGEPRENNAPPTMTVFGDIAVNPGVAGLSYLIEDPDGDIVTGVILADEGGGADPDPVAATNEIFAGRGWVNFHLPTGNYDLTAEIDDGSERVTVEIGTVTVP
ncbi:MAG TPA: hypothetical protein VFU21_18375 [Kofleriaceae bacterium]|nr:hypothetical protein [Kofleriaceae bacterium]